MADISASITSSTVKPASRIRAAHLLQQPQVAFLCIVIASAARDGTIPGDAAAAPKNIKNLRRLT